MSKSMDENEKRAKEMSDEELFEATVNAGLMVCSRGLFYHRAPWSPDGDVPVPLQELTACFRELERRMSSVHQLETNRLVRSGKLLDSIIFLRNELLSGGLGCGRQPDFAEIDVVVGPWGTYLAKRQEVLNRIKECNLSKKK